VRRRYKYDRNNSNQTDKQGQDLRDKENTTLDGTCRQAFRLFPGGD